MNEIQPITSSYAAVYQKFKFSNFSKEDKPFNLALNNNHFLIVVIPDTDGENQFLLIKGYCNTTGGVISVSTKGKSYRFLPFTFQTIPEGTFGFKLIDINGHNLFTPWAPIKNGYCEFEFSVNLNYVTLNGISF